MLSPPGCHKRGRTDRGERRPASAHNPTDGVGRFDMTLWDHRHGIDVLPAYTWFSREVSMQRLAGRYLLRLPSGWPPASSRGRRSCGCVDRLPRRCVAPEQLDRPPGHAIARTLLVHADQLHADGLLVGALRADDH